MPCLLFLGLQQSQISSRARVLLLPSGMQFCAWHARSGSTHSVDCHGILLHGGFVYVHVLVILGLPSALPLLSPPMFVSALVCQPGITQCGHKQAECSACHRCVFGRAAALVAAAAVAAAVATVRARSVSSSQQPQKGRCPWASLPSPAPVSPYAKRFATRFTKRMPSRFCGQTAL